MKEISESPRMKGRQVEQRQEQREIGQHLREARHDVGQAHDGQIVVADVADLVGQHAGKLVEREAAQQSFRHSDHGLLGRAGGEGVERHARDDVDPRRSGQLSAIAEHIDDVQDGPAVAGVERARAIHAHQHFGRQARRKGVDDADGDQRDRHAHPAPDEPGGEPGQQTQAADQQHRMQRIARLVGALAVGIEKRCHEPPSPPAGRAGQARGSIKRNRATSKGMRAGPSPRGRALEAQNFSATTASASGRAGLGEAQTTSSTSSARSTVAKRTSMACRMKSSRRM